MKLWYYTGYSLVELSFEINVFKTSSSKYFSLQINSQTEEGLTSFYPFLEQKGKISWEQRTKSFSLLYIILKKIKIKKNKINIKQIKQTNCSCWRKWNYLNFYKNLLSLAKTFWLTGLPTSANCLALDFGWNETIVNWYIYWLHKSLTQHFA